MKPSLSDLPLHARVAYRAARAVGLLGIALFLAGAAAVNGIATRYEPGVAS